jgi:predicted molibdopterin-dependent oxidoreductase YjgC
VQRFERAFPAPGQTRTTVEVLSDLLSRVDPAWANLSPGKVFDRIAAELPAFAGLNWHDLPATGATLNVPGAAPAVVGGQAAQAVQENPS